MLLGFSSFSVALLLLSLSFLSSSVSSVSVPYTLCASSSAHLKVSNVTATVWPPLIDSAFTVNVTGVIDKTETSGEWTISAKVDGIPLPKVTGDIDDFHSLPWTKGNITLSYTAIIPTLAPPGSYSVQLSAVDEDKEQILCADLTFKMKAAVKWEEDHQVEVVKGGSVMERWRRNREQTAKATLPM